MDGDWSRRCKISRRARPQGSRDEPHTEIEPKRENYLTASPRGNGATSERRKGAPRAIYRAARAAAISWSPRIADDPPVERLRRHAVDLALEEPAITIHWLQRESATEKLVAGSLAVALPGHRTIMATPVVGEVTYVGVLHELGHIRAPDVAGTLQREAAAWRHCRRCSIVWGEEAQKTMVRSINSYLRNAERTATNLLGAAEVEKLCSSFEYAQERQRRVDMDLGRERKNQ